MTHRTLLLTAGLLLAACRPDPGPSDYEQQEPFDFPDVVEGDGGEPDSLPGPNPYTPGDQRLSIGFGYESESSQAIIIDDATTHLYIYEETLTLAVDTERIEGVQSFRIEPGSLPWWGMGVHWDNARDLSSWDTLHISFRSADEAMSEVEIGLNDSVGTASVNASEYGWVADDAWHSLAIPLADFVDAGLDPTDVVAALVLLGGPGSGSSLLVDDVYYTASPQ